MGGIAFDADGGVTIRTGTLDYGQGHASPFAQVLSEKLGVPFEKVRLLQGDSDELLAGGGTGGSRSMMNSGQAIVEAAAKVVEQGKQIASHALEASAGDIEFKDGKFVVAGTDRAIDIMELATKVRTGMNLPPDGPQSLDVKHVSEGAPAAYPNGCHVCEVEVDPDTGNTEIVKYTAVNDFGTIINPMLVDGQTHGGVAQGIGQTLLEHVVYDEQGQLLSGSFMDYAMPRAHHSPNFEVLSHPVPAKTNPLGVKGCGEAGCAGSMTSIMNAVVDALSEYGIKHIDMPASPARVWQAIQDAKAREEAMTASTELSFATRRADDVRLVAGVSAAHFVSHFYMLVLPPLFAFVRADYAVSYTEIGLALTMFNAVSAVAQTPAGFLIDRINARLALVAGLLLGAAGLCGRGDRRLLLGADRGVRPHWPRQHGLSPGRLRAAVAPRRARAHEPGLFGAHLRRHARQRGGAERRAADARPVRLARRVFRRGRARPAGGAAAAVHARRRGPPPGREARERQLRARPTGGCC